MRRKMMLVVLMLGLLGVIAPVHHAAVTTAESRRLRATTNRRC